MSDVRGTAHSFHDEAWNRLEFVNILSNVGSFFMAQRHRLQVVTKLIAVKYYTFIDIWKFSGYKCCRLTLLHIHGCWNTLKSCVAIICRWYWAIGIPKTWLLIWIWSKRTNQNIHTAYIRAVTWWKVVLKREKRLPFPPAQCHISRRILIPLTPLTFAGFEYIDDGNRFEYVCGRQHESIAAAWRAEQFSMWMIPY